MKLVRRDVDLTSVEAARRIAKRKLPFSVYRFIEGGNEDEQTIRANREGFQEIGFRPRVPHDRLPRDLRTTVLGQELSMPVVISPAGFIRIAHPEGELAVARAAAAAGVAVGVSTLASYPIEAITAISPDVWFQVYMVGGRAGTEIAVERARQAGCRVLVVTVDLAAGTGGSDRPSTNSGVPGRVDLRTALRYAPEMLRRPAWAINFLRGGLELAIPNAASGDGQPMSVAQGSAAIRESPPTWDDIEWLRARWDGPFVIKGIVTGEDARRAIDVGADAVSVSNHGGNALDGGPATIRALPEVVEAVDGRIDVLLDGGVRRGGDVVKAVALGAKAVLIGRAYVWALAAGGEEGVRQILALFRKGIEGTLTLLACPSVGALDRSYITLPNPSRQRLPAEELDMDPDDPGSVRSDREAIVETVHRYASTIDGKDYEGLRGVLDDEFAARFGRRDWMVGADDVVAWIAAQSEDQAWQHHLLSVYHVDVVGDTAFVLSYLTAHQVSASEPGTVVVTVGRYHDELRRRGGVWKIAHKEVEVGWRETRSSGASG